jgi:hypothetical protein
MTTLFVRHQVADYTKWRHVYDSFGDKQKQLGVSVEAVYQAADDANDVTVTHEFKSPEAARAFLENSALREAMAQAGIVSEPTVWFGNRV